MYIELIQNAALLVALSAAYNMLVRSEHAESALVRLGLGLLFGAVAVAGMLMPFNYGPGIIFDGRSVVLAMAGLFGGGAAAATAAGITACFRLQLGGAGALTGVGVIATSALVGWLTRRRLARRGEEVTPAVLVAVGVVVHFMMLLWMLTLPWPVGLQVIDRIWLPVMVIFPAATLLIGTMLAREARRVLAERRLRSSEVKYRTLYETMTQGAFHQRADGVIVDCNPAALQLFGLTENEFLGRTALHPDWRMIDEEGRSLTGEEHPSMRALRSGRPVHDAVAGVFNPQRRDFVWLSIHALPQFRPGESDAYQVFVTLHDISERKRLEEALRRMNEELELRVAQRTAELSEVNRELQSFAYSVSHDLRAPLRAITGFAEIIARRHRESLDEEGRHYFDNILEAGNRMGRLISELLAYSRLGREALVPETVALEPLIERLRVEFDPKRRETGAQIRVRGTLPRVVAVPTLLSRALSNLIDNALEYRREGVAPEVEIDVLTEGKQAIIRVRDNGIGIAPAHHEKIFDIFQRLHSREHHPGTGIGLAIVKKAAQLMGGSVELSSQPGQGSCFRLHLPLAPS